MDEIIFDDTFDYKLIYIFEINDEKHKGLLKIGDATLRTKTNLENLSPNCRELNQAALKRIKAYTNTAGVNPHLLYTELAIRQIKNKSGVPELKMFRDYQVHAVLKNSGIDPIRLKGSTSKEWFDVDLDTAISAINAVKNNIGNLGTSSNKKEFTPIIFRPEQQEAINKTIQQFKIGDRMLWNAKMRFGKTLSALQVVKKMGFHKTIIATHRPVVDDGWFEDFNKIFYDHDDYIYGSKAHGNSIQQLLDSGKNFIYFASIQDLRGSEIVGGHFDKNQEVFDINWDLVIVDEAHEGTQTALGDEVIKNIVKEDNGETTKFLALSGTAFNIIGNFNDSSIYTWDYIMEQECKSEWDKLHFGDSNPYEELPQLKIYTYDLGKIINKPRYVSVTDKAFNFKEFFRTWTGDFSIDHEQMPKNAETDDFVHEKDVWSFLNLMTIEDSYSSYPYSSKEYRELFKHTLWMVPGVKEARALKKLMLKHPVFGSGAFNIVNVAGNGDEEEKYEKALKKVKTAIANAGEGEYTITLSCGKLTTGVTIREWTGVFMLSGSYSTSASNYLQTIFRVQSPANIDGKMKTTAYVFDFAPDRALKMAATAVSVSSKPGKTDNRTLLGKFLNFCPVISVSGSKMKEYDTSKLMQQLKKVYADRVVQNGFDDVYIYNDELLKLNDIDLKQFEDLKGIIGKTKAQEKTNSVDLNNQGLTDEEYEKEEQLKKKPKKELTDEEKAKLAEFKEKKKNRKNAISILRGISIRLPLLIYGADIDFEKDITINDLVKPNVVDDASWNEFMPDGVTKELFKSFTKYYDQEVFTVAGRRIRNVAKEADELEPTERVKKIALLFSCFKNPDKETVLTPWRVVNMHMSDTIGGYDFWDEEHKNALEQPRLVIQDNVTSSIFDKKNPQILEINSKTGLYPLYVAYTAYRYKCDKYKKDNQTIDELDMYSKLKIWAETVRDNIFVVCKTPMAKQITQRTLMGYRKQKINAHYYDDLINIMKNKPYQFINKVNNKHYWKKGSGQMLWDACVGNPAYQLTTGGGVENGKSAKQAKPIFHLFVEQAINLNPKYVSMIIPARWYNGGMGLNDFRNMMLNNKHLTKLYDYNNSKDCFPTVDIAGGLCYFLWDKENNDNKCEIINVIANKKYSMHRVLNQYGDLFVRSNSAVPIIEKIRSKSSKFLNGMVSPLDTFGIPSKEKGHDHKEPGDVKLMHTIGFNKQGVSYYPRKNIKKNVDLIDKYKVKISIMVPQGGEVGIRPENGYRSISTPQLLEPGVVDSFSYLNVGFFDSETEARNFLDFLKCKFTRFMMRTTYSSVHISQNNFIFVPMMNYKEHWNDAKLYKYFELTQDEINLIEQTMRPM